MEKEQEIVRIELTPEQKELVKKQTGKDVMPSSCRFVSWRRGSPQSGSWTSSRT